MANQGAKKRKEENACHMARLRQVIIACNDVDFPFIFYLEALDWPGYDICRIHDNGELLDGGFDNEYRWNLWVILIVDVGKSKDQQRCEFLDTFQIPAFGVYQSFGLIKSFLPQGLEEPYDDEKTRKKREKMEKKAWRTKFVRTRTR